MTPGRPTPASRSGVSPARAVAYRVVRRTFEEGAYTDRALAGEARELDPRERAFATALTYVTVQRRGTLDHLLAELTGRPVERLDAGLLAALRLGLAQIVLLDGVADHAAVHESVELAKRDSRGAGGLANAVLRRATREGADLLAGLGDATPAAAAVRHSVPPWLAELWFAELGGEEARSLLAAVNRPAEAAIRVNTLRADPGALAAALPVPSHPAPACLPRVPLPEGLVLEGPFDPLGSPLGQTGMIFPQSRASLTPVALLDPQPGERVLDLCAAPGAKTGALAARLGGSGSIVAVERHPGRAAALERTLARLGVANAEVRIADAGALAPGEAGSYDRVLVDPPCSGLGTLQSRPDLRWRATPERIAELTGVQLAILGAGAAALAPGGTLVYSVCTISAAEGEGVVAAFLAGAPEFRPEPVAEGTPFAQLLPHRDGTDGFFLARLRRL